MAVWKVVLARKMSLGHANYIFIENSQENASSISNDLNS